jgi:hypothetical protein
MRRILVGIIFVLLVILVGYCFCSPLRTIPTKAGGMSTTFLKIREIMKGDSWNNAPRDANDVVRNIGRYDAVWCAQLIPTYNKKGWSLLREKRPDILMLHYICADSSRPGGESTYYDYDYINRNHPEWFLLKEPGNPLKSNPKIADNRIRWSDSSKSTSYNRFFLDIGNPDFRKWAAAKSVELVTGKSSNTAFGFNGLAMDNVHVGWWYKWLEKRCPKWKYANNPIGWNDDYTKYLKQIKAALNKEGFILVANHSLNYGAETEKQFWPLLLESVDGIMTEQSLSNQGKIYSGEKWLTSIKYHETALEKNLIDWWVCYHPEITRGQYEGLLYTYCSWLLTNKPGKSFYHARTEDGYVNPEVPWYHPYDLPIGKPVSARYSKGDCWLRDYENGKVVVNPTTQYQSVVIDEKTKWFDPDNKIEVNEIMMPPTSGKILLSAQTGESVKN